MTILEFADKHWGFWFAVFVLLALGAISNGVASLAAFVAALVRREFR